MKQKLRNRKIDPPCHPPGGAQPAYLLGVKAHHCHLAQNVRIDLLVERGGGDAFGPQEFGVGRVRQLRVPRVLADVAGEVEKERERRERRGERREVLLFAKIIVKQTESGNK